MDKDAEVDEYTEDEVGAEDDEDADAGVDSEAGEADEGPEDHTGDFIEAFVAKHALDTNGSNLNFDFDFDFDADIDFIINIGEINIVQAPGAEPGT